LRDPHLIHLLLDCSIVYRETRSRTAKRAESAASIDGNQRSGWPRREKRQGEGTRETYLAGRCVGRSVEGSRSRLIRARCGAGEEGEGEGKRKVSMAVWTVYSCAVLGGEGRSGRGSATQAGRHLSRSIIPVQPEAHQHACVIFYPLDLRVTSYVFIKKNLNY